MPGSWKTAAPALRLEALATIYLLLVEDEPPILKDLCHVLQAFPEKYHIAAAVENAAAALKVLEDPAITVDVMITDIQMPGMNGLGLIERAAALRRGVASIVLTGYSSFDYARKAISLSVCDYLLKPVKEDELYTLLDWVGKKAIQSRLEKDILSFAAAPTPESGRAQAQGETNVFVLACAGNFPVSSICDDSFANGLWERLHFAELAADAAAGTLYWLVDGKTSFEKNIVFSFNEKSDESIYRVLKSLFEKLNASGKPITLMFQKTTKSLYDAGFCAQRLRHLLRDRLIIGHPQLLDAAAPAPPQTASALPPTDDMVALFATTQTEAFLKAFSKALRAMEESAMPQEAVWRYCYFLIAACARAAGFPDTTVYSDYVSDAISLSSSFSELSRNMDALFQDLFESFANLARSGKKSEKLLAKIDCYIQTHYAAPINTQFLAENFGLSPAYLSKVFREYKQMSPTEYIVHLRTQRACALFSSSPGISVKEVAALVGYDDPFYFSKVFKKSSGLSPKEFARKK